MYSLNKLHNSAWKVTFPILLKIFKGYILKTILKLQ